MHWKNNSHKKDQSSKDWLKEKLYKPLSKEAICRHPIDSHLSYIRPIYTIERLNEVFGIGNWHIKTEIVEVTNNHWGVVKVIFTVEGTNIYLEAYGSNYNPHDRREIYQGAVEDALIRIGMYLGIGIDVWKGEQSYKL